MTITIAEPSNVDVKVLSFNALGAQDYPLKLDIYQRPYVWSRQKVEQLLSDLSEFNGNKDKELHYYLGTLLLHRDDRQRAHFVIDGQQRLSSLAVIFHALNDKLPDWLQFCYSSPLSATNLHEAQKVTKYRQPTFEQSLFERLSFTVITVTREDLAFTFFDTQNNRGVPLKATDLLKAYHLRAVSNGSREKVERLQQHCARRWEEVQVTGSRREDKRQDFAPELFQRYLWRARNWYGQKRIEREDHDSMLETFQQQSVTGDAIDSLPLYPCHSNQLANRLCLQGSDDYRLDLKPVQVTANAACLPFSLRQPIHQGVSFFLYAQKYAALLDQLIHQPTIVADVVKLREFYNSVIDANSHYLRELFNLALLMYADRFGNLRLLEFAQRAELVLGGLRLEKQYIFKEAPLKYLKEADHNLLDVIAGAFRPDEVMAFLQSALAQSKGYEDARIRAIVPGKGVQGRYLEALLRYYDESSKLPSGAHRILKNLVPNKKPEHHHV